jgi:hypothetical protein
LPCGRTARAREGTYVRRRRREGPTPSAACLSHLEGARVGGDPLATLQPVRGAHPPAPRAGNGERGRDGTRPRLRPAHAHPTERPERPACARPPDGTRPRLRPAHAHPTERPGRPAGARAHTGRPSVRRTPPKARAPRARSLAHARVPAPERDFVTHVGPRTRTIPLPRRGGADHHFREGTSCRGELYERWR